MLFNANNVQIYSNFSNRQEKNLFFLFREWLKGKKAFETAFFILMSFGNSKLKYI